MAATASPAFAASRDGDRDSGEFCYYYNSNQAGSVSDFTGSVSDLGATPKTTTPAKSSSPGGGGGSQSPTNDYEGRPRGFAQNNRTAFAAYRIASRLGVPTFSNSYGGSTWGNAGTWNKPLAYGTRSHVHVSNAQADFQWMLHF